jgi:hypothetical protein
VRDAAGRPGFCGGICSAGFGKGKALEQIEKKCLGGY